MAVTVLAGSPRDLLDFDDFRDPGGRGGAVDPIVIGTIYHHYQLRITDKEMYL